MNMCCQPGYKRDDYHWRLQTGRCIGYRHGMDAAACLIYEERWSLDIMQGLATIYTRYDQKISQDYDAYWILL